MDLAGKAALITGGAKIGRAVAQSLARRGCHVALTYLRSRDRAEEARKLVEAAGTKALVVQADVRREEDLDKALAQVEKAFGRLNVLVNMASVYKKGVGEELWRDTWETDLGASRRVSLKAAGLLRRSGGGRIVLFSDWLAASGRPRYKEYLPYYVAKAGVKGLAEALALELAPDVLVNAIAPGPIEGPPDMTEEERREAVKNTPLGRWGGAEEIAKAVVFFAESDFVTGETLRVDGGRHLL